jgi:endo-1,3-1,4-beta-glycanase ExoK
MRSSSYSTRAQLIALLCAASTGLLAANASAVTSAELYKTQAYQYGRFEARIQFAAGDGIISSFFLWKDGSEKEDVFWNELDFEKLRANCELETNTIYGNPAEFTHNETYEGTLDLCGTFHTYTYEWTPEYIAWFIDGVEIRRETGETAAAYSENATAGMQIRFNIWPGDESFGGTFDPAILPAHEYVNWFQYSSYTNGAFQFEWREDFNGPSLPTGWATANWESPKGLSTHARANANIVNGYLVLSLTNDDATGSAGAMPMDPENVAPVPTVPAVPSGAPSTAGSTPIPAGTDTAPAPTSSSRAEKSGGCSLSAGVHGAGAHSASTWGWLGLGLAWVATRRRLFGKTLRSS